MKLKTDFRTLCVIAFVSVFLWGTFSGCSHEKAMPRASAGPTLYERLGGSGNIAVLVDEIVDRSYADPVFNANPKIREAHKHFPKAIYKFNATCLACQVFGGPKIYMGRSMKKAHWHLQIHENEWQELIKIFREVMDEHKVPTKEQGEILAIIESTKGDIVHPSKG
jgi:hemoglobin